MKKLVTLCMAAMIAISALGTAAFAYTEDYDSGDSGDINIGTSGGKAIDLVGHIEPTIISVTMPSYIPFDISKSLSAENKVVSPKITVSNNSDVPVTIIVDNARIDLGQLSGVTWSSTGTVAERQIAVGFVETDSQPTYLTNAKWLKAGDQTLDLIELDAKNSGNLFIVGSIGAMVAENHTFTVTPTLVVKQK